jgi:hypothetical protein
MIWQATAGSGFQPAIVTANRRCSPGGSRQLALLIEEDADRSDISFIDEEHSWQDGARIGVGQANLPVVRQPLMKKRPIEAILPTRRGRGISGH